MVLEEATEEDWKNISAAALFAGLAYIFVDVYLSGVINLFSAAAYLAVFIFTITGGQYLMNRG